MNTETPIKVEDSSFSGSGNYYGLFYELKDYAAEAAQVNSLIRSYVPDAAKLLELGCGTGNHAQHFTKLGFSVLGVDQSATMVRKATEKALPGFNAVVGDASGFQLDEQFDAAVSLFHVISYLSSNAAVLSCLQHVHKHLVTGGIFLFDTWYSPAVWVQGVHERSKSCVHGDELVERRAVPAIQPNANLVNVQYQFHIQNLKTGQMRSFKEYHLMRHFSLPEVQLLAQMSGFELLQATTLDGTNHLGTDTWSACFILKKNK